MDPYTYAQQQGQVAGQRPREQHDDEAADDLMDLLLHAYDTSGHMGPLPPECQDAVAAFASFANGYLAARRVASTGVVDGGFALVFEDGRAVQLASVESAGPARPDPTIPITRPRDQKMKGMTVVDTSVPMTGVDPRTRGPR
jgi:hypothetical protein